MLKICVCHFFPPSCIHFSLTRGENQKKFFWAYLMLIRWQGSNWTLLLARFAEIRLQLQTQQCSDSMLAQLLAQCWYNAIEIRYHWIRNFLPLHLGDPCCFWSAVNSNSYDSLKLSKFCHCTCVCALKPKWS